MSYQGEEIKTVAQLREYQAGEWIGVDFDGVLATYDGWKGPEHCGEPIPAMVDRVKLWLKGGTQVRILTSRVGSAYPDQVEPARQAIQAWCLKHLGTTLPVTCEKDQRMFLFYDDRAVEMVTNTGLPRHERFSV